MMAKFQIGWITGAGELVIDEFDKVAEMDPVKLKAVLLRAIEIEMHPEVRECRASGKFIGDKRGFNGSVDELVERLRKSGYEI